MSRKNEIEAARKYWGGSWPEELTSGVMFHNGERITRDEFATPAPPVAGDGERDMCDGYLGPALESLSAAAEVERWKGEVQKAYERGFKESAQAMPINIAEAVRAAVEAERERIAHAVADIGGYETLSVAIYEDRIPPHQTTPEAKE